MCQLCICTLAYFTIGFGLSKNAYGGFFGTEAFFMMSKEKFLFPDYVLGLVSCWQCVSIVSCSLAERSFLSTHNFMALFISGIIYPIAASWTWGDGWLTNMGFIDHAGSGYVHMLSGTIGLLGSILLKPRLGLFPNYDQSTGLGNVLKTCRHHDVYIIPLEHELS
jgi:Amt family ammonium transporter